VLLTGMSAAPYCCCSRQILPPPPRSGWAREASRPVPGPGPVLVLAAWEPAEQQNRKTACLHRPQHREYPGPGASRLGGWVGLGSPR
jgi:hypothetical protein